MCLRLNFLGFLGLILQHLFLNQRLVVPWNLGNGFEELTFDMSHHRFFFFQGIPASVQIFSCNKDSQSSPVARRSFFRCSTVQLHWNYGSNGLLIVAQSDVDKTNKSYYGESKLNYLTTDGSYEGLVDLRMLFIPNL